jgi:hypothetical protein
MQQATGVFIQNVSYFPPAYTTHIVEHVILLSIFVNILTAFDVLGFIRVYCQNRKIDHIVGIEQIFTILLFVIWYKIKALFSV